MVLNFYFGFGNNWFGIHTSFPFIGLKFVANIFALGLALISLVFFFRFLLT